MDVVFGPLVAWPSPVASYTITVCTSGGTSSNPPTCPVFFDGRLNNCEPWETSAIYCLGDGSVRVYVPGQPLWTIAFDASPAEIAKASKHPAHNTIIKGAHGAWLSRLTNGSLEVTTPGLNPVDGNYNFIFQDCSAVK
jgi:hypothetical protein